MPKQKPPAQSLPRSISRKRLKALEAGRKKHNEGKLTPAELANLKQGKGATPELAGLSKFDPRIAAVTKMYAALDEVDKATGLTYRILLLKRIIADPNLAGKFLDKMLPSLTPDIIANLQTNNFGAPGVAPGAGAIPANFLELIVLERMKRAAGGGGGVAPVMPIIEAPLNGKHDEEEAPVQAPEQPE